MPQGSTGHEAQADEVLRRADVLVIVVDERAQELDGGTRDTLARARQTQRRTVLITVDGIRMETTGTNRSPG